MEQSDFGRTVLFTGTGGAGRTTLAAATALASARRGDRTLLLTGESPEVLAAVLGPRGQQAPQEQQGRQGPYGRPGEPWQLAAEPGLWVLRVDPDEEFRTRSTAIQERCRTALELTGATPLAPDELAPLPGAESFALLRALRAVRPPGQRPCGDTRRPYTQWEYTQRSYTGPEQVRHEHGPELPEGGPWDVVIADLPPVERTLSLLALPEQLRRYLRRLLPGEKRVARALRPMLAELAGVPMPSAGLYRTAAGWDRELTAVQDLFTSQHTTVRLVTEPAPVPWTALRGLLPAYALYGLRVESTIANRVLPNDSADPWLAGLSAQQESVLAELRGWCRQHAAAPGRRAPDPDPDSATDPDGSLTEVPHLGHDPRGLADLATLGAAAALRPPDVRRGDPRAERAGADATEDLAGAVLGGVENHLEEHGQLHWRLELPGAERERLKLVRHGDELCVGVGPYRRMLPLPSALRRCRVAGAALDEGVLRIRFAPDPGLWPAGTGSPGSGG
ncbi:hypothetical protein AN216_16650 [Streptomyces oceani]|uniref:Arsenic ABC transporter ATPase n=1 Tax=Streptomyces oceani TaxID=1075402 RepID=A0A1E7KCZ0_9ACTN|nr:hypothetical protein AN216_16650 [Streptomyces oceani]